MTAILVMISTAVVLTKRTGLSQTAGQQEAAAGGIAPVLVAQLGRFLIDVERIARFRRGNHPGALVKTIHTVECIALLERAEVAVHMERMLRRLAKRLSSMPLGNERSRAEAAAARIEREAERTKRATEVTRAAVSALAGWPRRAVNFYQDQTHGSQSNRCLGIPQPSSDGCPSSCCCVPRSCAASPWVMERMTASLSATLAVFWLRFSKPLTGVGLHCAQRTAIFGRRMTGSHVSLMGRAAGQINIDDVLGLPGLLCLATSRQSSPAACASRLSRSPNVRPRPRPPKAPRKEVTPVRIGGVIGAATELISALFFHKLDAFKVGRYLASDFDLRFCECIHKNATKFLFFGLFFGFFS